MSKKKRKAPRAKFNPWDNERWFKIEEYFSPDKAQRLEMEGGKAFLRGKIRNFLILEVSRDVPASTMAAIKESLAKEGIRALIITDDIRFVKLRMCSPEEERQLNDQPAVQEKTAEAGSSEDSDRSGVGSVADGDGTDRNGHEDETATSRDDQAGEDHGEVASQTQTDSS